MHYFSSKNNSIPGKGRYRTGREVLVFVAGLGIGSWLKKNGKYLYFIHFSENIFRSDIFGYRG